MVIIYSMATTHLHTLKTVPAVTMARPVFQVLEFSATLFANWLENIS